MKSIIILLLLFAFSEFGQNQSNTTQPTKKITRDLGKDIDMLLPTGEITASIMDKILISPRRQELLEKYLRAINENKEWFIEQQKISLEKETAIPYDKRLGLTEAEFEEFKKMASTTRDMEIVSSGTAKILVSKKDGITHFKTEGKLAAFNTISIDAKNNVVKILNYTLTPLDTVCVTDTDNVFRSSWRGYSWEFSSRKDQKAPGTQEELSKFSMNLYKVTVGLLNKTQKTFLTLSLKEFDKGTSTLNYETPLIFE